MTVTPIGAGLYRVSDGERTWMVAVAGPPDNRWVWIDSRVIQLDAPSTGRRRGRTASNELSAPMPATVVGVMVGAGASVARGDTLIMLEAMKMELPIRAPRDGIVHAIHCKAGELVQPGIHLITLEGVEEGSE
jgi:3-methylcrotonyl-CoA carboxylase alpha subunit